MSEQAEKDAVCVPCKLCGYDRLEVCEAGMVDNAICHNRAVAFKRDKAREVCGIPTRYADATPQSAEPHLGGLMGRLTGIVDEIEKDARHHGPGVVICGPNGTGKTHIAAAMANYAISRRLITAFATVTGVLARVKTTFDDGGSAADGMFLDLLYDADVLVLDDLGKQRDSDFDRSWLYRLFEHRYNEKRATVVTTNLLGRQFQVDPIWGAVLDRLLDDGYQIQVTGDSLREPRSK